MLDFSIWKKWNSSSFVFVCIPNQLTMWWNHFIFIFMHLRVLTRTFFNIYNLEYHKCFKNSCENPIEKKMLNFQKWFHPIAAIHMRYFTPELIFDKFFSTKCDNKNSRKLNTKITIMFMILSTHMTHHIFSKEATKSCLVMVYSLFTLVNDQKFTLSR